MARKNLRLAALSTTLASLTGLIALVVLSGVAIQTGFAADPPVGPPAELLWPKGAPGAVGEEDRDRPDLRAYLPPAEKATGTGVIICPGGGYAILAYDHEGHQLAKWFNSRGIAAFVLKYRLTPRYRHPAPLDDAQRAIRHVRANSQRYGVDPKRIGIMGFSAGGHLASTAATHFDAGKPDAADPVDRQSCRPDFAVLCYAVVSFTEPFGHTGSKRNLLGDNADPKMAELLSNEKQVTEQTPPTFLFHTGDDTGVPVENALAFYAACRKAKVPAELHVYQFGPHGVGLAPADPAVNGWKDRLAEWLQASGLLAGGERASVKGKVTVGGQPLRWGMIALVPANSNQPRAWAMVSRGEFNLAANRGPGLGEHKVLIYNLGGLDPYPSLDDYQTLDPSLKTTIAPGANELNVDVKQP
ncbi:MAG TPA: alpha/beta hydrolase [Pirellulaceae bacterium]|nr:alpha/beta hydrolase [Pirellulaceae bacterium]